MQPDFLSRLSNRFLKKCAIISIYRDISTFLEKTIIQSWPKIWLHLYTEIIPHLRKQLFTLGKKSGYISR